jgi:hypothetical protein
LKYFLIEQFKSKPIALFSAPLALKITQLVSPVKLRPAGAQLYGFW